MNAIDIRNLTKDYGSGRGVFDVTLKVEPGEVYGYLGPNGAGKSTTIRHLMGFMRPQSGQVLVEGRDCWKERRVIQKKVGYLPGEKRLQTVGEMVYLYTDFRQADVV